MSSLYGKPIEYIYELERRVLEDSPKVNYESLLMEISALRAKVSFYEDRVGQMQKVKEGWK